MNDLFTSFEEAKKERIGIMADSGIKNAAELAEIDRHACEIRRLMSVHYPDDSDGLVAFFNLAEKHRGKDRVNRLRDDCREAWGERMKLDQAERKAMEEIRAKVDMDKVNK